MAKPISRDVHSLLDYAVATVNLTLPSMLGLPRRAKLLFGAFGLAQGGLNAVTEQPYALAKKVPFRVHGKIEAANAPTLIIAPLLFGLHEHRASALYWAGLSAALVSVYFLTDWESDRPFIGQGGAPTDKY
jgi:hypothetical protein